MEIGFQTTKANAFAKIASTFMALLFCSFLHGQIDLRSQYQWTQSPNWEEVLVNEDVDQRLDFNHISYGLGYWFRLKNYRLEFFPNVQYGQKTQSAQLQQESTNYQLSLQKAGFFLDTQVYLFDLKGDCDCPTWSKEGPTLKKGLFLLLSPGMEWNQWELNPEGSVELEPENKWLGSLGAGLGMDFGISDLITVTPYGGIRLFGEQNFDAISMIDGNASTISSYRQFFAGLKMGFRFDEVRRWR